MRSATYIITDELGIHARPAGELVKKASEFQSDIQIQKGDKEADAKRLFAVLGLAVKRGDTVILTADGADEVDAIAAMEAFLKANL